MELQLDKVFVLLASIAGGMVLYTFASTVLNIQ